jgi:hypothetical protein
LATSIGLSIAAIAGSQPAAAQSYSYTCPAGFVYDPTYGCTSLGGDDYGYHGYPTVLYGRHPHHDGFDHGFGHGFGHGMRVEGSVVHHGMGFGHSIVSPISGGGAFAHGIGSFGHGMAGGFGHGGGGGHR